MARENTKDKYTSARAWFANYNKPPNLASYNKQRERNKFFTTKVLSQKSIDEESKLLNAFETIELRSKENKKDQQLIFIDLCIDI